MRRTFAVLLIVLFTLGLAGPVLAQGDDDSSNVRYKKRTEIDFEDVAVDGELKKPHGAYLLDKRQSSFNPLIRLKENFNEEMVDSVNQIR
jgi:hypothetical protein